MAFDNPRRRNSNDPAMPTLAIEHHAIRLAKRGLFIQPAQDAFHDPPLFILSYRIEFVEAAGNIARLLDISLVEKIDHVAGDIHTAGSIHSWSDAERNLGCGQRPPIAEFCNLQQRLQSNVHRTPQTFQSQLRKDAILSSNGTASAMVAIATTFMNDMERRA